LLVACLLTTPGRCSSPAEPTEANSRLGTTPASLLPEPAFAEQGRFPLNKFEPVEVVGDVPQPGIPKN
jgi:hypothetical protein